MTKYKNINYIHFDTIDSTNTWAKNNAHTLDPEQVTCITALEQTNGRGRWNRSWISPKGQNITATIFFCLPRSTEHVANLAQILSLSCAAILQKNGFSPQIKWPNDVLLNGKKIAGVLCETVSFEDRIGIVLGIGINVNMTDEFLKTIDQPATSLAQLSGHTWAFEQILEPLLQKFLEDLSLLQKKGFKPFRLRYEELLAFKGQMINCNNGEQKIQGICDSINNDGRLNLVLSSGERTILSAGEVSAVRKTDPESQ